MLTPPQLRELSLIPINKKRISLSINIGSVGKKLIHILEEYVGSTTIARVRLIWWVRGTQLIKTFEYQNKC